MVRLLKWKVKQPCIAPNSTSGGVARRACDAITNLAHENAFIKDRVRDLKGIPSLVQLLSSTDLKVQRAAAGALRTLAFKNDENKVQIVAEGALDTLIMMLSSEDDTTHYEAIGVIGNLVHSSAQIKQRVLESGALQPVIELLRSTCTESQREAALLLGQFATAAGGPGQPDQHFYKVKIVQRGAVPPLIEMLSSHDVTLQEMAAFAIGRLAQNHDNQAGIVSQGGLLPLIHLLDAKPQTLQHNAAFALYGLADNEYNIPAIIKDGGFQMLESAQLVIQQSKDCVAKTIKRLHEKMKPKFENMVARPPPQNQALGRTLQAFRAASTSKVQKQRIATALVKLTPAGELQRVFLESNLLEYLIDIVCDPGLVASMQAHAARAVVDLHTRLKGSATDAECQPGQPDRAVYLGKQFVNNDRLSDITFIVEGRPFYCHRIALCESSKTFNAMLEGEAQAIEVPPDVSWAVFHAMMVYLYTGESEVPPELATQLLKAADYYLLDPLKLQCQLAISGDINVDTFQELYDMAYTYTATHLQLDIILFILSNYEQAKAKLGSWLAYSELCLRGKEVLTHHLRHKLEAYEVSAEEELAGPDPGSLEGPMQGLLPGGAPEADGDTWMV